MKERQRALLQRLAAGEEPGAWAPGEWRSAYALRDRGLLTVSKSGGHAHVEVAEAGRFYLRHCRHPDDPAFTGDGVQAVSVGPLASTKDGTRREVTGRKRSPTPYSERPIARARRAKALELVERLVAEGRVRIADADDDEVAEWRRVVDYAKRHGLEPQGRRIEKARFGARGLEVFLAEGPHPNSRTQRPKADESVLPVPTRLSSLHPAVAALKDDDGQLVIPAALRRRSLLLLQALAAGAVRRGYEVRQSRSCYSRREGGVDVAVDGFAYAVTVRQEFPQSTNPERSARIVVELDHGRSGRPGRWRDQKSRALEDALGVILGEIEARALEDAQRRKSEQRAMAEREVRWRAAMEEARKRAVRDQLAEVLREEAGRWQEAAVLGAYCDALERRLAQQGDAVDEPTLGSARRWLEWAREFVQAIDPLNRLPEMPTAREPTSEELKAYLKGWSPYGPERRGGR
ncbi:hypothetical protein [Streptomyces spiramyceticus]|uniref:hypothetical protein n=1 Tax=Streptomyces spiramyceticus TaxID=299717 RepID=UPI00237B85E9|nr:hypothetical protein [Streptomyces spiramyceticus]